LFLKNRRRLFASSPFFVNVLDFPSAFGGKPNLPPLPLLSPFSSHIFPGRRCIPDLFSHLENTPLPGRPSPLTGLCDSGSLFFPPRRVCESDCRNWNSVSPFYTNLLNKFLGPAPSLPTGRPLQSNFHVPISLGLQADNLLSVNPFSYRLCEHGSSTPHYQRTIRPRPFQSAPDAILSGGLVFSF